MGALRPGQRGAHDGVRVPAQNAVLVFGGDEAPFDPTGMTPSVYLDEVWKNDLQCEAWTQLQPPPGPGKRGLYVAAFDDQRNRMIVMGGRSNDAGYLLHNDVWAFDPTSATWSQLAPTGTLPAPRQSHRAVWDAAKNRMLIFGGNGGTLFGNQPLGDTWELSFASGADGAWRRIMGAGPTARQDVSSTLDSAHNWWVIYGGAFSFIAYSSESWAFDLATDSWKQLNDSGPNPGNRFWGDFVDAGSGTLVLFGGHDDGPIGLRNDSWSLAVASDGTAAWTPLLDGDSDTTVTGVDHGSPERRDKHSFVPTGDGRAWLFGGVTDCGPIDDLWLLDLKSHSWSNPWKAQVGETCARQAAAGQSCPNDCGAPL
jgi:hypothetical protein